MMVMADAEEERNKEDYLMMLVIGDETTVCGSRSKTSLVAMPVVDGSKACLANAGGQTDPSW